MPTAGTHITIVQLLALDDDLKQFLGDPDPSVGEESPAGRKMRFANLGAIGPDVFYAMADYSADLQDLENFLIKVGGTFECIGELMEEINRYVSGVESRLTGGVIDSIRETFDLIVGIFKEGILALLVNEGQNFWPVFEAKRQLDRPREEWFWADFLHYIRSGQFTRRLLELSKESNNENLQAYALGYLTHYVTDVVGHPYVNQVVHAPWRMYWQRHHLVENFIDAYVWATWHDPSPAPHAPTTEEPPLDKVLSTPHAAARDGAEYTFARLNDHIAIGTLSLGDPVDALVTKVCTAIHDGFDDISGFLGRAEDTDPVVPDDDDFRAWTEMVARAIKETYDDPRHPMNLSKARLVSDPRPAGYPEPEDIAAAYGAMRLYQRLSTEEKIQAPQAPTIGIGESAAEVWHIVKRLLKDILDEVLDITSRLGTIAVNIAEGDLVGAIGAAAELVVGAIAKASLKAFEQLASLVGDVLEVVTYPVRFALYIINTCLFALYRSIRDCLVVNAYAIPFTEELFASRGQKDFTTLWQSPGGRIQEYPIEELTETRGSSLHAPQRDMTASSYSPIVGPGFASNRKVEKPRISDSFPSAFPYADGALPNAFIDAGRGHDDMFHEDGPVGPLDMPPSDPRWERNFGGAVQNCRRAIQIVTHDFDKLDPLNLPIDFAFPDYNLDGDRGYAWPCWDTNPSVAPVPPSEELPETPTRSTDPNVADYIVAVQDPLNPVDFRNAGVANVVAMNVV